MKVLCEIMLFFRKKCIFPVFLMVNLRIPAEGLHFFGGISENGEPDSGFALLGVF